MRLKGTTVEILNAKDVPFSEHKDLIDFPDTDSLSQALIEIPAAGEDLEFGFHFSADPNCEYFRDEHSLSIHFYFNDSGDSARTNSTGTLIDKEYPQALGFARDGHSVGWIEDSKTVRKQFRFEDLDVTDKGGKDKGAPSGFIEVRVWEFEVIKMIPSGVPGTACKDDLGLQREIAEKKIKGKDISYTIEAGVDIVDDPGKHVEGKYVSKDPTHKFRFHYRTRESLIARRLIELPTVNDVSDEEDSKIHQVKREADKLRQQNIELKRALRLSEMKRKRREGTEATIANDSDSDVEIVPGPPPRKKIVVDLTAD